MNQTRIKRAAALAVALGVTGCAVSMPDWRGGYDRADTGQPGQGSYRTAADGEDAQHPPPPAKYRNPGTSIQEAILYLVTARNAYQTEVRAQMDKEGNLSQGLLAGAGALLAAAGLKAHPDTFVAGGAALSTIYAMGTAGMPRSRVLAYMAGIEALNCAEAAVAPIQSFDPQHLKEANEALRTAAIALQDVLADVAQTTGGAKKPLMATHKAAQDTLAAANGMVQSTDDFIGKAQTAAYLLSNHVEKVDAAVVRSIINGTPDLADVKILSGAIGADITGIVGKAITDANNSKQASGATQSAPPKGRKGPPDDQQNDIDRVETAHAAVIAAMQMVREQLPVNANNLNMQPVADCNLPSVPAPLVANLATVTFFAKTPQTTSIELKGGTKEYVVDGSGLPAGLTVKPPGPTGSTLDIVATDQLTKVDTYSVRIHDQTPGGNGIIVQVVVAEAAPKAAAFARKTRTLRTPKAQRR